MTTAEYLNLFFNSLRELNRSEATIRTYNSRIVPFFDFCGKNVEEITKIDIINYLGSLKDCSSATRNLTLKAINSFYTVLSKDLGLLNSNPSEGVRAAKVTHKVKIPLTPEEIDDMIDCGKNSRDRAIIATMSETGMRISELCSVTLKQYVDRDEDNCIVICGKGSKERFVPLSTKTVKYINEYLNYRKGNIPELFVSNNSTPMDPHTVRYTLKDIARRANFDDVKVKNMCNHLLRASCITNLSEEGVPLETLQTLAGHSSPQTTMIYLKVRKNKMLNDLKKAGICKEKND
jgi:integrase/recombinase XerD